MTFTLRLTPVLRQQLYRHLHRAYASGSLRLVKRLHALLALAEGMTVHEVAHMLDMGEQTVRDYLNRFFWQGVASFVYKRPPGRPAKLTKTQRQELAALIKAGPQAAGYPSGCWSATIIQDLIHRRFGVEYHPHYSGIPSSLYLYPVGYPRHFVSESTFCLGPSRCGDPAGVAPAYLAQDPPEGSPAQGAVTLWR